MLRVIDILVSEHQIFEVLGQGFEFSTLSKRLFMALIVDWEACFVKSLIWIRKLGNRNTLFAMLSHFDVNV